MNRGRHTSYQCRIGNMKGDSSTVRSRPWLDYTMLLQCLLYKGPKGEEQKNKNYLGRFPYLQGRPIHQAGYNMSLPLPRPHLSLKLPITLIFWLPTCCQYHYRL